MNRNPLWSPVFSLVSPRILGLASPECLGLVISCLAITSLIFETLLACSTRNSLRPAVMGLTVAARVLLLLLCV